MVVGPFRGEHLLQMDRELVRIERSPLAHFVARDSDSILGF
jgi:hypothetical protein